MSAPLHNFVSPDVHPLLLLAGSVATILLLAQGWAQDVRAERLDQDLTAWQTITIQIPIHDRVRLNTLVQTRQNHRIQDPSKFLIFQDVEYFLDQDKHWAVAVGGSWHDNLDASPQDEARVYEQIAFRHPIPTGKLFIRNRLVQRFIQDTGSTAQWNRTLVEYTHPFQRWPGWAVSLGNEFFVNLYSVKNGPQGGVAENRSTLTLIKTINKHLELEGGYMFRYLHRPGSKGDSIHHAIITQAHIKR